MAAEGEVLAAGISARSAARFTGRYPGRLDAKGRVVIPTEFRQRLEAAEVYCFASLTEGVVQCGGSDLVDQLLETVRGQDVYDEDRWALEEAITAGVLRLSIDDTGRAVLPRSLKDHAGLDGPAGFAGRGQHFVLARADYLDARAEAAKAAALRNRDTLRARMLPSVQAGRKP